MQEPRNHADGLPHPRDAARQEAATPETVTAPVRTRRRRAEWVWVLILALTSIFQFGRGAPSEGVAFAVPAIALCASLLWGPGPSWRVGTALRRWLTAAIAVLGALAILLPDASPLMTLVVALIGAAALPFAWGAADRPREPHAVRSRALTRTMVLWASLMTLLCVWELTSFALGEPSVAASDAHPTISSLIGPQLTTEPLRSLLIVAWIAGGIVLLRRGVRR